MTCTGSGARHGWTPWPSPTARSAPSSTSSPPGVRRFRLDGIDDLAGTPYTTACVTWLDEPVGGGRPDVPEPRRPGAARARGLPRRPGRGGRARRGLARPDRLPDRGAHGARPADRQRVLEGPDAATRLRTVRRPAAPRGRHRRPLRGAADPAGSRRGIAELTCAAAAVGAACRARQVGCRAWTSRTSRTSSSAPTARATGSAGCRARSRGSPRRSASWRRRSARARRPSVSTSSPTSSPGWPRSRTRWTSTSRSPCSGTPAGARGAAPRPCACP